MDVWGAHIPLSWWTAVALAGGVGLSAMLWRPLSRRCGWRPHWTAAACVSVAAVLALTLTPGDEIRHTGLRECIPQEPSDVWFLIFHTGGGLFADVLNVLLMWPVTVSLVMATRRVLPALLVSPLMPLSIELTQILIPGRVCAVSDLVTNTIGGLLGAASGWALQRTLRRRYSRV